MLWFRQDRARTKGEESSPYARDNVIGTERRPARGSLGVGRQAGTKGRREANKAGMLLKQEEMPIYDRPINVLGNKEAGDLAPRDVGKTNPRG